MTDPVALARWSFVVVVAYLLQIGVLADLSVFGVHPELMLAVAACAGLGSGPIRGAEVGFVAGLLVDLLLVGPLGLSALTLCLVGFGTGVVHETVLGSSRTISSAIVGAASAAGVVLYASLTQLLGGQALTDPRLWVIIGIVSVVNAALCSPVLAICRWAEGDALHVARS